MDLRILFTFTFVYACLLYVVTQYGEIQTGKTKSWCIVDVFVISIFLKNAIISFLFWESKNVQNLVTLLNVAILLWFVLPLTGLGKKFTMQFAFMNFTLAPLIFVFLYGSENDDCVTHLLGFGAAATLPAWFIATTSETDIQQTTQVSARIFVLIALVAQIMTTLPTIAQCKKGVFFIQENVWLALLRFLTCALLGYGVTMERINMQSS